MSLSRLTFAIVLGFVSAAGAAAAPEWPSVPAKNVTLLYPGQSSLEWATSKGEHRGAEKFNGGKSCAACHIGEEAPVGAIIALGRKLEPSPIPGKPGSIVAKVQVARDAQRLYVRLEFSDAGQPHARMGAAAAKVAMMLGGDEPVVARAGCWAMCHDDSEGMAKAHGARTMYLGKMRRGGGSVEYWEVELGSGVPAAANGTVSDARRKTKPLTIAAEATHRNGVWTVTLSRPLQAGTVSIVAGKRYIIAFAIDVGHTAKRFHYVSFERSLVLGQGTADFVAK